MFIDLEKSGIKFDTIKEVAKYLTDISVKVRGVVFCEFQGVRVGSARHYIKDGDYDYFESITIIIENFYIQKLEEKDKEFDYGSREKFALFNLILSTYPQLFETLGYDRERIQRLVRQSWRQEDFALAQAVISRYFE